MRGQTWRFHGAASLIWCVSVTWRLLSSCLTSPVVFTFSITSSTIIILSQAPVQVHLLPVICTFVKSDGGKGFCGLEHPAMWLKAVHAPSWCRSWRFDHPSDLETLLSLCKWVPFLLLLFDGFCAVTKKKRKTERGAAAPSLSQWHGCLINRTICRVLFFSCRVTLRGYCHACCNIHPKYKIKK